MDNASQTQARIAQEAEREAQRRRLREESIVQRAFEEFPSKFKIAPGEVLRTLGTVRFDADGNPLVNGTPLRAALEAYAAVNAHAVAQTVAEIHDGGASTVRSKADLDSPKAKSDFIATHGLAAFERLPLNAPQAIDPDKLDWESYRRLPVSVKAKLVDTHPNLAATLKRREQDQRQYQRLVGVPAGKQGRA